MNLIELSPFIISIILLLTEPNINFIVYISLYMFFYFLKNKYNGNHRYFDLFISPSIRAIIMVFIGIYLGNRSIEYSRYKIILLLLVCLQWILSGDPDTFQIAFDVIIGIFVGQITRKILNVIF
jgi:hypothetical protein